ncbi:macrolide export ATP-binding/permease protein MacB [Tepidibacillus sp. HK-1]|nr:macrolide export ATP-binding/permease protein MacB [Tepidibacillus sp. HK-1]
MKKTCKSEIEKLSKWYKMGGADYWAFGVKEIYINENRRIGFIFQNFNLLSKLTSIENVELPLIYAGISAKERIHHRPVELSGGASTTRG